MASKAVYSTVAILGIAAASGAAWWFQNQRPGQNAGQGEAKVVAAPAAQGASAPAAAGRPPAVEAAKVRLAAITDETQTVGSLRSRQGVMIRPEVGGRITQLNFNDGARVNKGQLLVQLDDQLQAAQVQQSQAELSIAQANHKRNQELVAQGFISQRSVDESAANLQVSQAKLALAQASAARLKIVAPFDGIAGIRTANVGDYLKDGADIVNLEDIDALYVDFRLPERYQTKVQRGQQASVDVDALPGRKFVAVVQAIDPLLDANGRSVAVRACIDNRQLQLRPGMFARVNAVFGERQDAHVVPEEALVPQGQRQFVMLLQPTPGDAEAWTTKRVEVKVGVRRPGQVEVVGELQPGDMVVTAGQQRVQRDGTLVRVVDVGAGGTSGANNANNTNSASANAGAGAASSKPTAPRNEQAGSATTVPLKVAQRPAAVGSSNPCARDGAAARSAPPLRPASKSAGAA